MQFDSLAEFIAMGGHGLYVWLAYGATLLGLSVCYVSVRLGLNREMRNLALQAKLKQRSNSG